ncbi:YaiI/YqxD family protein [bacterium]|nr:YaiI/YqxD family protein [bacterium]
MRILVDGDAMPGAAAEILFRAASRKKIAVIVVANSYRTLPDSPLFSFLLVSQGPDIADDKLVELTEENDLVITADIPLAHRVVEKGGFALNPRGELYTKNNIGARLDVRDYAQYLRDSGMQTGGSAPFGQKQKQAFAAQLDRFLAKYV